MYYKVYSRNAAAFIETKNGEIIKCSYRLSSFLNKPIDDFMAWVMTGSGKAWVTKITVSAVKESSEYSGAKLSEVQIWPLQNSQ